MGYDSRSAYYRLNYLRGERVVPKADLDSEIEQAADRLNAVLNALRAGPLAERLVVFGSVARGRFLPGDVDAVVDLRTGPPVPEGDSRRLLDIAYEHYGSFDPFVILPSGRLRVRGERAISWTDAENAASIMAAIRAEGRPLGDLRVSPDPAPAAYEPDEWLSPAVRRVDSLRLNWDGMTHKGWCRPAEIPKYQRQILAEVVNSEFQEVRELFEEFSSQVPEDLWDDLLPGPLPGP